MKTSESIMNLSAALLAAASKIRPLVKDSNNPFFNSKYADVNQTIEALKSVLLNNDVWFMQFPHSTENSVGVVTRVIHSSGEFMEHEYVLPLAKRDPQAAGSAITYARRYALVSIFGLQAVDDDAQSAMRTEEDDYKDLVEANLDSLNAIREGIASGDLSTAHEAWAELDEQTKVGLWKAPSKGGWFTTDERTVMKSTEFRQANGV
jgi:hypothetical protein